MRRTTLSLALVFCLLEVSAPALAADATDAQILALEISGELLPPPLLVSQIESDLARIWSSYPYLQDLGIGARGDWEPGGLLMRVDEATGRALELGEPNALDALNEQYGPLDEVDVYFDTLVYLSFALPYHPLQLGSIYETLPEVEYANPNHYYGDGSDIRRLEPGLYELSYRWGDCPAGCTYEHNWQVRVAQPQVYVEAHWGDPVGAVSTPAAGASALLGAATVAPNPFNPHTELRFDLRRDADVRLDLFDLRGRHLRRIEAGHRTVGPHALTLAGVDGKGRSLASGTYLLTLRLDGQKAQTLRMTLVR